MEAFDARVDESPIDPRVVTAGLASGAVVTFSGQVRDEGGTLAALTLEHYPAMTEKALADIVAEARRRWPDLAAARILHRVGRMTPGETIVMVATASAHRATAFEAANFLMDYLKTRAPFWKREERTDGTDAWVEAKSADDDAAARWQQP